MAWTFFKKRKQDPTTLQKRGADFPPTTYIQPEGPYYELSEFPPAMLSGFRDLINGYYSASNFITLFHCLPEIFAPVHEIASRVASCNWQLKKDWNDEVDYKDADFNRLFTTPNPLQSFRDFVYQAVCYEILTGKQFFQFNRPGTLADEYKNILTWNNLPAGQVKITVRKETDPYTATELNDLVQDYRIPFKDGKQRVFGPTEILPFLTLNLERPYDLNCTKSQLLGAEKPIKNLIPVYEARGTIYIKRGVMGFMVSKKSDASGVIALTKEEKDEANADVNGRFGLTGGKSTISVTAQPVDFVKTSMSISEMKPFDETLSDAVAIYAVLRVPRHLVPSKDTSTFDNADADLKRFYDDVIIPMAKRYADAWTNYMRLKDFRRYIHPDFSHVAVLQENRKEKAEVDKTYGEIWEKRIMNGIATLNDWIRAVDGTPVTGNVLYDKKSGEMTPEELEMLKNILNLKRNGSTSQNTEEKTGSSPDNV